ncbi:Protein of unknown function [Oceanobacillus limi]|uniref:DUF3219 domain-containing protein n=1 Tax=Oceanobacillus limi TaxID=930131 RepID=A0A1I0F7Q9_9BACI|nr:DUF3219 family protein [Oceanobacillus limi]SET53767.1 Protein of unknown function [Oceanobacillus limi]
MKQNLFINDFKIEAEQIMHQFVEKDGRKVNKLTIDFIVSHEDYHDVTTLLYKNNFDVKVPDSNLSFQAKISNYATSITNLYEENSKGTFHLELQEM